MEVVRSNFKEALPLITESIKKADYLSIDAEFTGLLNGRDVSLFDLPEEYYMRLINGCSEFMLIQFGLCAFYWDEKRKHYMNDAYNFYLFPRGRPAPERMFLCQSSSIEFLAANGFDFNKLIKEGITYMTESTETKLRENLTEKQLTYTKEKEPMKIPDENKQQIEDICKKVKDFIDENSSDEMEIDRVNAFIRLLLFQELRKRFKEHILVDTKILENKSRVLKVTRRKPEDPDDAEAIRKQREWDELEDAVGFSKVARMISQSEKLVVGHNMLLDVIHTLNHFFQPLPADYNTFKEFAHCMFPKLIDTKYMSSLPPFKDKLSSSVLPELLSTLTEEPFTIPKVGCIPSRGYMVSDEKQHEAGYDAYVTGLCFLAMHHHLQRMRADLSPRVLATAATVKPFLNKLFLAKTARQDSPYINLAGSDPSPPRDHVFHMTFPKEWQRSDINQLFSPFGQVMVNFIDDTSALVGLDRREQAADVVRALSKHTRVSLTPFYTYKKSVHRKDHSIETRADPYKLTNTGDFKQRQVLSTVPSPRGQQLPERASRARSSSASMAAPAQPSPPARKRTSSGVFQVDESEPAPKRPEISRSLSDSPKKKAEVANGCQKTFEKEKSEKKGKEKREQLKEQKKAEVESETKSNVADKFDSEAKSNSVSAFKESDSWD